MAVCLAAGAVLVALPVQAFILSWSHSVERTHWQEHWRVEADALVLDEARIEGSGAGLEPPASARLVDGMWIYRPDLPPLRRLRLGHSEFAGDYSLCWREECEPLATIAERGRTDALEIFPCADPERSATATGAAGATEVTK